MAREKAPPEVVDGIRVPRAATLARYGLTREQWLLLLHTQGGVCAVCGQKPSTGRLETDHFHVKGWRKMPPSQRRLFVRGLVCWWDNSRFLGRGITVQRAQAVATYLRRFEAVRPE